MSTAYIFFQISISLRSRFNEKIIIIHKVMQINSRQSLNTFLVDMRITFLCSCSKLADKQTIKITEKLLKRTIPGHFACLELSVCFSLPELGPSCQFDLTGMITYQFGTDNGAPKRIFLKCRIKILKKCHYLMRLRDYAVQLIFPIYLVQVSAFNPWVKCIIKNAKKGLSSDKIMNDCARFATQ